MWHCAESGHPQHQQQQQTAVLMLQNLSRYCACVSGWLDNQAASLVQGPQMPCLLPQLLLLWVCQRVSRCLGGHWVQQLLLALLARELQLVVGLLLQVALLLLLHLMCQVLTVVLLLLLLQLVPLEAVALLLPVQMQTLLLLLLLC